MEFFRQINVHHLDFLNPKQPVFFFFFFFLFFFKKNFFFFFFFFWIFFQKQFRFCLSLCFTVKVGCDVVNQQSTTMKTALISSSTVPCLQEKKKQRNKNFLPIFEIWSSCLEIMFFFLNYNIEVAFVNPTWSLHLLLLTFFDNKKKTNKKKEFVKNLNNFFLF